MFSPIKILVCCSRRLISRPHLRCSVVRDYCRWVHRRPVRVIEPEDYENGKMKSRSQARLYRQTDHESSQILTVSETSADLPSDQSDEVRERISSYEIQMANTRAPKGRNHKLKAQKGKNDTSKKSASENETPFYTKLSENDAMFSNLMSSVKSKKQREKKGYILLEGRRLIADSIAAGAVPQYVFFSRTSDVAGLRLPATQLYKIPYKTISLWSDVTTSQGVIAICKLPASEDIESSGEELPLTIVCDNVREPGNLGAILRTAVGAGCRQVVLTKGCMDLWDPKVLRSGVGAHFRMKIFRDVAWEDLSDILGASFVCLADNNLGDADCGELETGEYDQEAKNPQARHTVPVVPYYDVNYARQTSVVLVLGGEAHGLSPSAYQLAASRKGVRVHIPLANGTESLNTGTALGVIVFEMKRQFLTDIPSESEDDSFSVTKC